MSNKSPSLYRSLCLRTPFRKSVRSCQFLSITWLDQRAWRSRGCSCFVFLKSRLEISAQNWICLPVILSRSWSCRQYASPKLQLILLHGAENFLRSYQVLRCSRNSPHFMEFDGSLWNSQDPATCSYPEQDQSSPCPHRTSQRSILILSSHLHLGLPSGLVSSDFHTKTL